MSSNWKKRLNWRASALRGSVRIVIRSSRVSWWIAATTGRRPMNSGIRPYSIRSSGSTCSKYSPVSLSAAEVTSAPKPTPWLPIRLSITLSSSPKEPPQTKSMFEVSIVRNSWCGCLRPPCGGTEARGALEDLEERLLDALARDVARDRRVVRLAGDLVDLVDVDDPGLRLLHVEVGGLDQLEEDVLDVLADVARLGQRRGIGDRERDVEDLGEGLGEQRLAAAGRAEQQDVRLLQLDLLVSSPSEESIWTRL